MTTQEDKDEIITKLNEEIDELLQENKELHAQNNRFQVQRDELLDENQELKRELDDLKQMMQSKKRKEPETRSHETREERMARCTRQAKLIRTGKFKDSHSLFIMYIDAHTQFMEVEDSQLDTQLEKLWKSLPVSKRNEYIELERKTMYSVSIQCE